MTSQQKQGSSIHLHPTTSQPLGPTVYPSDPADPVIPTTLQGQFVTLVPLLSAHAKHLWPLFSGPENEALWTYMPNGPYTEFSGFEKLISAHEKDLDRVFFAIVPNGPGGRLFMSTDADIHDQKSPPPVGYVCYLNINPANQSIQIGQVFYSSQLQRSAPATEVIYLLLRHAFETLGYNRVEWKCDSLNFPSRRAAERYGFVYEGLFRRHVIAKGRRHDTWWASIVEEEWWGRGVDKETGEVLGAGEAREVKEIGQCVMNEAMSRKVALEKWLDRDNFDGERRQKRRLEDFQGWKKKKSLQDCMDISH